MTEMTARACQEAFDELMFLSDLNWKRTHFNADGVQITAEDFSFGI